MKVRTEKEMKQIPVDLPPSGSRDTVTPGGRVDDSGPTGQRGFFLENLERLVVWDLVPICPGKLLSKPICQ